MVFSNKKQSVKKILYEKQVSRKKLKYKKSQSPYEIIRKSK